MTATQEKKLAAVQAEIAAERAAALGRTEARLRKALDTLRRFDAGQLRGTNRNGLLGEAAEACLSYVVQREALGLPSPDLQSMREEYALPDEVWNSMGASPAAG